MNFLDSRLYRILDTLTNFFLLNILWMIACVPLITIFPATAALFAVVRAWLRGTRSDVFRSFFQYMRENFAQSLAVGLLWSVIGLVLVADYLFVRGITSWIKVPFLLLLLLVVFVYLATAVYLFPVMVHVKAGWLQIIKNSALVAFSSLGTTFICLIIMVLALVILIYFPITVLLVGSVTAYGIYYFCQRAFARVEATLTGEN